MIPYLLRIILTLLCLYSTQKVFTLHPMSLFSVGCVVVSLLLEKRASEASSKNRTAGAVMGFVFALFTSLAHYGNFLFSSFGASIFYILLFSIGLAPCFSILTICLYDTLEKTAVHQNKGTSDKKIFLYSFAFIFLVWCCFFLAYFPGIYSPDSLWQLQQALGDSPLSNHHPVIHTLLMRLVLNIGNLLFGGNLIASTSLLSVLQMLFLALCIGYGIMTSWHIGCSFGLCAASALFFALVPFNIMFSFTHLKDSWFAGFFLVFCSLMTKISSGDSLSKKDLCLFALSVIGSGLFRSNGLYALLLLLPFLFVSRKTNKKVVAVFAICLILCFIITGPVYSALGVTAVDPVEYLSIPLQQISRAIVDGGKISESDYALLSQVINPSLIPSSYYARISDNIKNLIRTSGNQQFIADHKVEFLSLWFRLLMDNPSSYINAYVDQTLGFWYPEQTGIPFVISTDPNPYGVTSSGILPAALSNALRSWTYSNNQQSFLGIFYSCGGYVWLFLLLFAYSLTKKGSAIVFLPSFFLWGTLLLTTPVYGDIRYLYAVVACLPLLFSFVLVPRKTA